MQINVECYAGYRGEETPRQLLMTTYKVQVKEVLDRWLSPEHRYFKLRGDDDATYIVRHDTATWQWELVFYQAGGDFSEISPQHGES